MFSHLPPKGFVRRNLMIKIFCSLVHVSMEEGGGCLSAKSFYISKEWCWFG